MKRAPSILTTPSNLTLYTKVEIDGVVHTAHWGLPFVPAGAPVTSCAVSFWLRPVPVRWNSCGMLICTTIDPQWARGLVQWWRRP